MTITASLVLTCKEKLLEAKMRLLNQLRDQRNHLIEREYSGDEGDLGALAFDETQLYFKNRRLREQLVEIELALGRIERGSYGICEETEEPIEAERLLTIPWTRLSIEGADLREANSERHTS